MESAGPAKCRGSMPGFLRALQTRSRGEAARARVQEQDLRQWGLTGQWPRSGFLRGLSSRWDLPRRAGGPRARNGPSAPRVGRPVCFVLFYLRAPGPFLPALRWGRAPMTRVWGQLAIAPAGAARGWRAQNE